jgi:hypothetical protein
MSTNSSKLSSPWLLLTQAWNIFSKRAVTLWGIMLIPFAYLFVVALLWGASAAVFNLAFESVASLILMDAGLIIFAILFLWAQVSLIHAIVNEKLGIKEAYDKGRSMFWDYIVLSVFMGFVVLGGFIIFVIPGILLSIYFGFSVFILVSDGDKETTALLKSYEYVRENWWNVFWRIAFIVLIFLIPTWLIEGFFMALGMGENIAKVWINVLSMFFAPLATIYSYQIYKNLKSIKGHFHLPADHGKRELFIGLFVFALVVLTVIAIVSAQSPCVAKLFSRMY